LQLPSSTSKDKVTPITGKIKLKLRPHTKQTKDHMTKKGKNHLIMVNTTAEKEVGVVLDYLA